MRDPQARMRMGARSAASAAHRASDRMADVQKRKLVGHVGERRHWHHGVMDAHRAGEMDGEAEAADLAEENGRRLGATHCARCCPEQNENGSLRKAYGQEPPGPLTRSPLRLPRSFPMAAENES
jgi:hypothetical protein